MKSTSDTKIASQQRKAELRRQRERNAREAALQAKEREEKLQAALVKPPLSLVEQQIENLRASSNPALLRLFTVAGKKAPRLIDHWTLVTGLKNLSKLPWLRDPDTWEPRGKGRETLFRSLCDHLLAKYPMPPFLWSAFFAEDFDNMGLCVAHVAAGGSVFEGIKMGLLSVPLTRKMCHDFMLTPSDFGFLTAIRRTEVRSVGGSNRLLDAWMASQAGRQLHAAQEEAFWLTVLEWFGKAAMVDPNQVSPLVDYILYRQRQEEGFSMKGRSPLAMLRGMTEWHGELAKAKAVHGQVYKPSGFKGLVLEKGDPEQGKPETWYMDEILTSKGLIEEGRVLTHCVYSYGWSIEKGNVSIWSLSLMSPETGYKKTKKMTIEVQNTSRRVVQFRGKCNRLSSAKEFQILTAFANLNGLGISTR